MSIQSLMVVIAILLLLILWQLAKIAGRLKKQFPTDEEQDYEWSQKDPAGHWEAHKGEKENGK